MSLVGKFLKGAHNLGASAVGGVAYGGERLIAGAGHVTKKTMLNEVDKSFANGYTGYKASGLANGLGFAATAAAVPLAFAYGNGSLPGLKGVVSRDAKVGTVGYNGAPSVMDADGVGSATSNSAAPSLGATGSLVFGLHNSRKG
jgi:hypothetical protein